jgi:anti-sigma B factor antagonist
LSDRLGSSQPRSAAAAEPARAGFRLTHSDLSGRCRQIAVEGELDFTVSDRLREAIAGASGSLVRVDLERCEFIDSSGIAVLLRARARLQKEERRVLVSGASGQVFRLLSLIGLALDRPARSPLATLA